MATRARRGPAVAAAVVVSLVAALAGGAWFVLRGGERPLDPAQPGRAAAGRSDSDGGSSTTEPLAAAVTATRESESDDSARWPGLGSGLAADDVIRVQIVDAHEKPQPGLVATFGLLGEELSESSLQAPAEGPSAIATIRGVRAAASARSAARGAQWGVSVLVPSRVPPFVPIDPAKLPKEPVVVHLPPCGRLELSFLGRDGTPILRTVRVRLLAIPSSDDARRGGDGDLFERSYDLKDGLLELPCVECGLRFDVWYELDHVRVALPRFDGPTAEGETVSRDITCEFGSILFRGFLVGETSGVVAHRRLTLRVVGIRGLNDGIFDTPFVGDGESDDHGLFQITLPITGVVASRIGALTAYDCELDVRSPTGPDRTLKAVATIRAGTSTAALGPLRLSEH